MSDRSRFLVARLLGTSGLFPFSPRTVWKEDATGAGADREEGTGAARDGEQGQQ